VTKLAFPLFQTGFLRTAFCIHSFIVLKPFSLFVFLRRSLLHPPGPPQETTRYVTWPGQATAYKVGELKLNELRKLWETEGGGKLDIRDFYHEVLTSGAVPLYVLEAKIRTMIEEGVSSGGGNEKNKKEEREEEASGADIVGMMSFANGNAPWCKCCPVPGSHLLE